jgi:hypothetical protein
LLLLRYEGWSRFIYVKQNRSKAKEHLPDRMMERLKKEHCRELVTHTCNPGYSGGKNQEDCGSKPSHPWGNSSQDPISEKPFTKKS